MQQKQTLTDRQTEIAIAIREIVKIPDGVAWGNFTDFIRAIATMLEGVEILSHPTEMQERFNTAWEAQARLWTSEHNRIAIECLGSQKELNRVKSHRNGQQALKRIISRVVETHGGLAPGMEINVDVGDILVDEITE